VKELPTSLLKWFLCIEKQIVYLLKQEELAVWYSYNVILIIPVPPGMLVYLQL
jgi:Na+/alanine symporter